jgi:hypothetical protein
MVTNASSDATDCRVASTFASIEFESTKIARDDPSPPSFCSASSEEDPAS